MGLASTLSCSLQVAHATATCRKQTLVSTLRVPAPLRASGRQRQWSGGSRCCRRLHVAAIGFDLPGAEASKSAEKHAEELCRAAASLLLYTSALKGKPAQAFLAVLQLLQKGNPLSLTQQYAELFRLLAADGYASWMDYLLDQVIKGADNPLAKAAASGKPTTHLQAALAHDLDLLQQLAVADRTLAGWVRDTAFGVGDAWLDAASSLEGGKAAQSAPQPVHEALLAQEAPPPVLLEPLSEAQRAGLRERLAGAWRWSEGAELLTRYYAAHGCGLISQHRVLQWTGKLQAQDVLRGAHELGSAEKAGLVTSQHSAAATLVRALTAFLRQDLTQATVPPHVALRGNAADRWLFTVWALQRLESMVPTELQPAAAGLRTLVVPAAQLRQGLSDLAWSLSQHPRCRFAVVVNGGLEEAPCAEVAAVLSGVDGFSWPPNAIVLAGFAGPLPPELQHVFSAHAAVEHPPAA